jgi:hypothetical protein
MTLVADRQKPPENLCLPSCGWLALDGLARLRDVLVFPRLALDRGGERKVMNLVA